MPSLTGGIVLVGSRILVPADAATARPGFYIPWVASITEIAAVKEITGTVKVEIPEAVEAVVDVVSTVGEVHTVGAVQSGRLDAVDHVGYVGTIGTIPASINYFEITAVLDPESEYVSDAFDASKFPGGIGFSIAYASGGLVPARVYYQNSYDGTVFRTVGTVVIPDGGQDDRVFSPTRPYWRFVVVNASNLQATINAVVSLMPPGA